MSSQFIPPQLTNRHISLTITLLEYDPDGWPDHLSQSQRLVCLS